MVALKSTVEKIKDSEVVISWLQDLSYNSKINYVEALAEFCIVNKVTPEEILEIIHQEEEERKPTWQRSINKWFEAYDDHFKKLKRRKSTRDTRRAIANAFIGYHGLPQYKNRGGRRKMSGLKETNKRGNLTKEEIKLLLQASKTFKMKAMILAQASSGLASSDMLNLKLQDFQDGLCKVYDDITDSYRRICCLNLERKKTGVEFTTFFSEETVKAIETYLEIERINPQPEEALFSSYKIGSGFMTTTALQSSYRQLNNYLGWKQEERGRFRKATSHMMRKTFNTLLINAGMPEEIREHFMGHVYKDKVRDAYFLPDPQELLKIYLKYMDYVTIEKREVSSEELASDQDAKINELEAKIKEMKKQLEKVSADV